MRKKLLTTIIILTVVVGGFFVFSGLDYATKLFQFRFDGSWRPTENPFHVGPKNYVTLKNLRYENNSLETVDGYSEINSTPIASPVSGFHFQKDGESHIVAKVNDSGTYYLYENTTAIPGTGNFDSTNLHEVSDGRGYFANGPAGTMFYADDENALVWGGDELRVASFLVSEDSDAESPREYASKLSNDLETEYVEIDNLFASVVLLLHMEGTDSGTTFTDDSNSAHTVTANGGANTSTDYVKFGVSAAEFDGAGGVGNSHLSIPDSNDWNFGSNTFSIDFWFRNWPSLFPTGGDEPAIYEQYVDANNYVRLYLSAGMYTTVNFEVVVSGSTLVSLSSATTALGWKHVAVVRGWGGGASAFALCINGVAVDTDTYAGSLPDLAAGVTIGYGAETTAYLDSYIDEMRVTKAARWMGNFTPPDAPDSEFSSVYAFIGSPLKINDFTVYLSSANSATSTITVEQWNGRVWDELTVTDGTDSGGISMAQDGTVSWPYSEDAELRFLDGKVLYWYRITLSAGAVGLYKVCVGAPLQSIRDIWNGSDRTCTKFAPIRSSIVEDHTFMVESVDSTTSANYSALIGGLVTTDSIYIMFDEPIMGIRFVLYDGKANQAVAKIDRVSYWNGSELIGVGNWDDTTLDGAADTSLNKSGVVSWSPKYTDEHPYSNFGIIGYLYVIGFDGTLTTGTGYDGVSVDYVGGISAPKSLTGYDMVGVYGERVLLIDGNRIDYSQTNTPWVFNGIDSFRDGALSIYIGDEKPITAIGTIHNRFGSNVIQALAICKNNETHLLSGSQPYISYNDYFVRKKVSSNIGCSAPMTMRETNLTTGDDGGILRNALMWLDAAGPVIFEGTVPVHVAGVENYFDPSKSECINYSYIYKATAYVDTINTEYNLIFPTGSSTVNNAWIVYNYKVGKWYEKVPAAYPVSTFPVRDSNGGVYNYGLLSDGTMVRLDNGSTWDGTAIAQQVRTGEFSLPISDEFGFWNTTHLSKVKIVSEAITEDRDITVSAYVNGSVSSKTITIPLNSGSNLSRNTSENSAVDGGTYLGVEGYTHQIDFSATTSSNKWNPLYWGVQGYALRED